MNNKTSFDEYFDKQMENKEFSAAYNKERGIIALIDKVKSAVILTDEEVLAYTNEMGLALERDIATFSKGMIPLEESEFARLWGFCHSGDKNIMRIFKIIENKLMSSMDYFNSNEPFGPKAPSDTIECYRHINEETGQISYDPIPPWRIKD